MNGRTAAPEPANFTASVSSRSVADRRGHPSGHGINRIFQSSIDIFDWDQPALRVVLVSPAFNTAGADAYLAANRRGHPNLETLAGHAGEIYGPDFTSSPAGIRR
jgi:hypothetical protein